MYLGTGILFSFSFSFFSIPNFFSLRTAPSAPRSGPAVNRQPLVVDRQLPVVNTHFLFMKSRLQMKVHMSSFYQ